METREQASKRGKRSRASGKAFERRVKKDLEKKGWIILKNPKNVDLKNNCLIDCKPKFNPFTKNLMMNSGGLPDFLGYKFSNSINRSDGPRCFYEIIGVESKMSGNLDKEEKEKFVWLLDHKIFSKIYIASKDNRKIKYSMFSY